MLQRAAFQSLADRLLSGDRSGCSPRGRTHAMQHRFVDDYFFREARVGSIEEGVVAVNDARLFFRAVASRGSIRRLVVLSRRGVFASREISFACFATRIAGNRASEQWGPPSDFQADVFARTVVRRKEIRTSCPASRFEYRELLFRGSGIF